MFLVAQHELLLQIIERPDDDHLRLVLADQLREAGDPLGELILVQCSIERLLQGRGAGDWTALKERELELVKRHGTVWHEAAAPFARRLVFKRGLPHTLHASANALLEDGGLTVLAPIEQLELEHVDAVQLEALFALPLLRRVKSLGLPDVRGLYRLTRAPGPMPPNIARLRLAAEGLGTLEDAVKLGLLDHIEELELDARFLLPSPLDMLYPPAAPNLKRLAFVRLVNRGDRAADEAWLPRLKELLEARPPLVLVWRGIEYEAANVDALLQPHEPQFLEDPVPRPASEYNREPFGELRDGKAVPRGAPTSIDLRRLADGSLIARGPMRPEVREAMQSISLDAAVHLQLPVMPGVLTALSFVLDWESMLLRFEPWPSRSLGELELPLPPAAALSVVAQLGGAMLPLRAGLRELGIPGWPRFLSVDDVLLGFEGRVKLLPPFGHCMLDHLRSDIDREQLVLGHELDPDLEGTDDGLLVLLGSALMHLLAGAPVVSRRLRPSALNVEWKGLDPLVEGCLATRRALLFPGVDALVAAVNASPLAPSQDAVALHARDKQSSPP